MATNNTFEITDIYNYIKSQGQKLETKQSKYVLFLGETGKGKSTLTEFLSGNSDLTAEGKPGAYIIVDKSNRISNPTSTMLSQTTFPQPVPLSSGDKGAYYLDCPGFRDTRSIKMDISCTICMKQALQNCCMAKIVFVITYEDVKNGGDRSGFLSLVQQASEFISNLDKFANSIALFVTKVPPITHEVNGTLQLVSDEIFKQNVVEYLLNVRTTIKKFNDTNSTPKEKRVIYEDALKLISFLIGSENQQSHIGIFMAPNKEGSLQDIKVMQKSKTALNTIISKELKYRKINENDFGYSFSSKSKLFIADEVPNIVKKASQICEEIVKEFVKQYQQLEENTNIEELTKVFCDESFIWKKKLEIIESLESTLDALIHVSAYIRETPGRMKHLCVISDDTLDKITEKTSELTGYIELISLFEKLTGKQFQQTIVGLFQLLKKPTEFLETAKIWYESLPDIFKRLSKYCTSKENIADKFARFKKVLQESTNTKNVDISAIKACSIFKPLSEIFGEDFSLPVEHISTVKVKHLRRLYDVIFEDHTTDLLKNTTRITGNFISLSSVSLRQDYDMNKLKIFAAYKVFIDCDFERIGNNFQLTIIAPEWEIVGGKRKIVLDGQTGSDNNTVAKNGSKPGNKGEDGVAGLPSGNGGYFIGIGSKIINYGGLEISVCGGKGGKGQKGGNGEGGKNGVAATKPDDKGIWFWEGDLKPQCDKIESKVTTSFWFPLLYRQNDIYECVFNGTDGGCGGDGGDGGMGGIGGHAGNATFISFTSSCEPKITERQGKAGESGEGGLGSMGGLHGDTLRCTARVNRPVFDVLNWREYLNYSNMRRISRGQAADGVPGRKGESSRELIRSKTYESINNKLDTLHEYLDWFSNAIKTHPLQNGSIEFSKKLETLKHVEN